MNTTKWCKPSYLAVSLLLALTGCNSENVESDKGGAGKTEPGGYMYFFEQGLPSSITTTSIKPLTISNKHFKDGNNALQWRFNPNSQLVFSQDIGYKTDDSEITPYTFMAWIYNETPSDKSLTFQFGTDDNQQSQFSYGLNFKGWRGISVPFRDMKGTPSAGMNRLTVTAPDTNGTLYFDQAMMAVPVDNRWPTADIQQPFVNPNVVNMASKNWTALLMYDQMLRDQQPSFNYDLAFDDSQGDTAVLYQNFDKHLGVNSQQVISQQKVDDNLAKYQAFMISQNSDGSYVGKPLDHPKRHNFLKTGIVSDDTLAMLTDTMSIRTLGKTMLETAKYLRSQSLSTENKAALEKAFTDAARYAFDQGWEGGSGFQIITHVGYQTREFFDALFVARKLLSEQNLLQQAQQSMMWFNATGRVYEQDKDINSSNVDILNTQLQWMTKSFLLLPDQAQRQTMLHQLQSWLSTTLLSSDGLGGGFKPDGSVFHHSQHYPAYGKDAFGGLSGVIFGLSHSSYQISQQAHERIKDVLLKMRVYTKETQTPIVLSGRHPDGKQKISATPFKWMAQSGAPDQSDAIDHELAAAYANLTNKPSFEGISAEKEPTGVWAMNYASMAIARGANPVDATQSWLATARGFSRYLVGNETYAANNLYGRYLQYGQFEITPADLSKRAFSHDGWDWNRYPGTTTIQMPNNELRAQLNQLPGAGIEEMLLSTESYSGANTLGNDNAMFAMTLHGHKKYQQQSFYAHKSYFIFGNKVVALGSGIKNDIAEHETQTTLFQHSVKNLEPVEIDGQQIDTLGTDSIYANDTTLLDPAGNRYFVTSSAGQQVHFTYQMQQSNDEDDAAPTTGQFATAVIEHGKAPTNGSYEYAIKIAAQDAVKPIYTVLQKDQNLHAVRTEQGVEGYAFFSPTTTNQAGWVLSSASASQIMLQANPAQDQLSLSVVNPDLALYQGQDPEQVDANGEQVEVSIYDRDWRFNLSQPVSSEFTLKGQWQLIGSNSQVSIQSTTEGNTTIRVTTKDAKPEKFMLKKV
ncbi:chondroitinase family polysaccharide lyase [Photobacterium sanguinicancri]|uniref:Chondroitin sulfate ABC lyase n=1 Tax=Photobacterium sanguinicancri TaxID=875932 RepID=A0ABX4FRL2_9GAMM|nr:chondroitinase family polysaccharide lyase [Photobacterium sanguinicancri]OZS41549.1 chondroitinase [Photobacterium sanguinicancri]